MVRIAVLLALSLVPLAAAVQAQPAYLVRDTTPRLSGPSPSTSKPHDLTPTQGKLFFRTGDQYNGVMWATDGTPGGTLRLPDPCSNDDQCLISAGPYLVGSLRNLAFWVGTTPRAQRLLWRSDGTWAGTFALHDPETVHPYSPDGEKMTWYASLGGFFYFPACTEEHGCELWRTDGTREGTRLFKDLAPGSEGSRLSWLIRVGSRIFFLVQQGHTDVPSLWVTDGTASHTTRLRELSRGDFFFEPLVATAGGKLFFTAIDNGEAELWVSDGTAAGTRAVSQFTPPDPFEQTEWLKPLGSFVYFLADDVEHGMELWRSDGTATGTVRVTEFGYHKPFGAFEPISASQIEAAGERVVFVATDGLNGFEYWSTSGTPESTVKVADPCPTTGCDDDGEPPSDLILAAAGGRVVFPGYGEKVAWTAWSTDGTPGGTVQLMGELLQSRPLALSGAAFFFASGDLWRTDGTPEGTRRFAGLAPTNGWHPDLEEIVPFRGRTYFSAESRYGLGLWASDGRPGGTALAAPPFLSFPSGSGPRELTPLGDRLLFLAHDGQSEDLWRSSGTTESTAALGVSASVSSSCSNLLTPLRRVGGKVFYLKLASSPSSSCQESLWVTDGTTAGTVPLPGDVVFYENAPFLEHQGRLWFLAREGGATFLWKSDGTPQGTGRALDFPAEAKNPDSLTSLGPDLYFAASDSSGNRQAWRSDGTTAGTKRLTSFDDELEGVSYPPQFTRVGATVFFVVQVSGEYGALWATDGTPAGTRKVLSPFWTGSTSGPQGLIAFKGALYFFVDDGRVDEASWSLWRSDGTAAGTVPIQSIGFHDEHWQIEPTILGGELFFLMYTGQGRELWKTDGTAAGTRMVRDIFPGSASSWPAGLTAAGGKLYFSAEDGLHGVELWESDGTEAGTRMVQDISPLSLSSYPAELTAANGFLFFRADDGIAGSELWALPLGPASPCQPSPTHLCLGGGRFRVEAAWKDFSGRTGRGQAVGLTPDTGYFWFFDPKNVEVIAKVLDGRAVNDHHWVFYGALSNVEYSITVTDTQTGLTRRYFNPSGQLASVGDSQGFGPSWDYPEKASPAPEAAPLPLVSERTDPAAKAPCVASATRLCVNGNRFAVEVSWKDFSGNTGTGKAVALTGDTGYFWFFDAANVELVLKVLDGRPVNNKFWVFYGALSSVEYTVTVTDTETGAIKTYQNPSGRLGSVADTAAF